MSDKDFSYKDIESVESLFQLPNIRIQRALTFREASEIAKIALHRTIRFEPDAVKEVKKYFTAPEVVPTPPECICPPANGLRWQTTPVTWAYNPYNQDLSSTAGMIRSNWAEIEAVCSFRQRETAFSDANIVITNEYIDGRTGTLGLAYQPASGDRMAACGPMCGNIIIDKDEIWTPEYLRTVMLHEMLHAIGLPHSTEPASIMYARYTGPKHLTTDTISELQRRYPDISL